MIDDFNVLATTGDSTVVAEYEFEEKNNSGYQSEEDLEKEFVKRLVAQGYEYIMIESEDQLKENVRTQIQLLNDLQFTDHDWDRFYTGVIANNNENVVEKTRKIQEERVFEFQFSDGSKGNIKLLDDERIQNNRLQVINQYESKGERTTRFDVTVLVNGLPMVHIELKRRGVPIREAFNQIKRYQRDSFWVSSGLFEYVQIFVISNGTNTKYYSNTVRDNVVGVNTSKVAQQNYQFTSFWADATNQNIPELMDFTRTFFSRHTLLNILVKYCVFNTDDVLMVMRPYQIVATERILNQIEIATHNKSYGSINAGGYVWHTTGSGKTLTSFKTAKLATDNKFIDKVIFVVDRQDLDNQTMKEFNKFEEGSVSGNTSTRKLIQQLEDPNSPIIITTIQKLSIFVKRYQKHKLFDQKVVLIFDEAHRSQFGEMHQEIVKKFNKYYLFGFTGTPIFATNANPGNRILRTTEQVFGKQLHTYTIVDAINDQNVLSFKVDYVNTIMPKEDIDDVDVEAINTEGALSDSRRIKIIVEYILKNYHHKTSGFNSLFAVSSIPMAIKYYNEFKRQQHNLDVATIFSFNPNEDVDKLMNSLGDEDLDTSRLDKSSRDYLDEAIADYNAKFNTNFSTDSNFENYYRDVSRRMKNNEIDILIVVNMFLTGFDAPTMNTLWVDKFLQHHGLIQAYSRTNRIYDDVKSHGNIISFRDLRTQLDESLSLYANEGTKGVVLIRTFDEYYYGYEDEDRDTFVPGYKVQIERLLSDYSLGRSLLGESDEREFISLYGTILRIKNILKSFDEFNESKMILSKRQFQDYQSIYVDLYQKYKQERHEDNVGDDLVFELDLVHRDDINIDYILRLIDECSDISDEDLLININKAVDSSISLRSKKKLILSFIDQVNVDSNLSWKNYIESELEKRIEELINKHSEYVRSTELVYEYVRTCFKLGYVNTLGTGVQELIIASRFSEVPRSEIVDRFVYDFSIIFEQFNGIL